MFDSTVNIMPLVIVVVTSFGLPLTAFVLKLGINRLCDLAKPYIGDAQALVVQQRADALLDKGIGEAALYYLPKLQAQGLTVDLGNMIAARVASYAVSHAPDLAAKMSAFEGSLEEKARARLVAHPAVQAAVNAGPAALPVTGHAAA